MEEQNTSSGESSTPNQHVHDFSYPRERLEGQRQWHSKKADRNRKGFYLVEIIALTAGAAIPVINVLSFIPDSWLRILSAFLGVVVVVVVGIGKLYKFQENWLSYRSLSEALKREQELYNYRVADYDVEGNEERNKILVERVENMLASMTSQYVSLHRAEPRKQEKKPSTGATPGTP